MGKDASWFEKNSSMKDQWLELIKDVKESGMRFAYHF